MLLPIKQLRQDRKMTQAQLSEELKVSPSTVGMWEQGHREPDYETFVRIADYFDVSADYLLGRELRRSSLSKNQSKVLSLFGELNSKWQNLIMEIMESLRQTHAGFTPKNEASVVQSNTGGINNLAVNGNIIGK